MADYIARYEADDTDFYDDGRYGGDYCRHGTYIGTPGGADFMCMRCELGDFDEDVLEREDDE